MLCRKYSEQEQAEWRDREYDFDFDDLETRHWLWWDELDPDLRDLAVAHLRANLPPPLIEEVRAKYICYGDEWMAHMHEHELPEIDGITIPYSFHYAKGMGIRNLLRLVIGDEKLPSGNWDDFYVAALLTAIHRPFDQEKE